MSRAKPIKENGYTRAKDLLRKASEYGDNRLGFHVDIIEDGEETVCVDVVMRPTLGTTAVEELICNAKEKKFEIFMPLMFIGDNILVAYRAVHFRSIEEWHESAMREHDTFEARSGKNIGSDMPIIALPSGYADKPSEAVYHMGLIELYRKNYGQVAFITGMSPEMKHNVVQVITRV